MTNLPVFPGAEGFGSKTRAGRGGKVIEVTSLADSGPGTLREALEDPNPRIIVFRVGGLIEIDEPFYIRYPFVTIAGQTAPGDGITIKNGGITILTHDILLQSLRVRPGAEGKSVGKDNDSIGILGPKFAGDSYNIVLDHISVSWAEDENISIYEGPSNITVSWSIISEGLNKSRHQEGEHSTGLLIGDRADKVSVHHNIFAHNEQRNPMNKNGGTLDIRNNVIYNWGNDANIKLQGNLIYILYFLAYLVWAYIILFKKYKSSEGVNKKSLSLVTVCTLISFLFGLTFDLILPLLGNYRLIWIGPYFTLITLAYLVYIIFYRERSY